MRRAVTRAAVSRRSGLAGRRCTVRTWPRSSVAICDPLLLDLGEPGLELLEARRDRREQLLGRLHPLLRRGVDRPALLLGDLVGQQPELLDHRLPAGLDLLGTRHGARHAG